MMKIRVCYILLSVYSLALILIYLNSFYEFSSEEQKLLKDLQN